MAKKQYRFNSTTLQYDVIREPRRLRVYRILRQLVVLLIIVIVVNLLYATFFYTPKLGRLENERNELLLRYKVLNDKIRETSLMLDDIKYRDNKVYRQLFAADTLSIPGVYSEYPEYRYDFLKGKVFSDVMLSTWKSLDEVARRIYLQSRSLDQIQILSKDAALMTNAIPAIWPIDKRQLRNGIGSFGMRFHPKTGVYKRHDGIDLAAKTGSPVYSTADGVISLIESKATGYGKQIIVDHGFGYKTRYAHLSYIDVKIGQYVKRGEEIGKVGNTGLSTGPHLHYEVIYRGTPTNPVNYFRRDMSAEEFENIINNAHEEFFEM